MIPLPILAADDGSLTMLSGVAFVIGLAIGAVIAVVVIRAIRISSLGSSKAEGQRLIENAKAEAETLKKQVELDGRNAIARQREEFAKETEGARNEIKENERRITKREDLLDRKLDTLTTKEKFLEDVDNKLKARELVVTGKEEQIDQLLAQRRELIEKTTQEQKQILLRVASLSPDEARKQALAIFEQEVTRESAKILQHRMEQVEENAKEHAQKIILQSIQRYASEHTATSTVNSVAIPSDDMKGRIIGREGRNIRAFEKATGVDVIVDDTPGVIVVSCFDPVRRAVAAEALSKLIEDGRIHPTRIEEIVEGINKEMAQRLIKFGKEALIEVNLPSIHPKVSEMMGRLQYRTSYGQNILRHSIEVGYICQIIADELGLDGTLARRAGFLHDIGKAMDHEVEGGHPAIGMEFCRKYGEREEVLNAIGGHHNDIPSISPYTPIVMAADAISGARPGARRETLEKYIKRLQQLEEIATGMKGVRQAFAIQAGREVRVIVDPDNVDDATCHVIARDIAKRVSEEMTFPGEIRVTVLREMRTVEYAR
jgi:ribonuclease Y